MSLEKYERLSGYGYKAFSVLIVLGFCLIVTGFFV